MYLCVFDNVSLCLNKSVEIIEALKNNQMQSKRKSNQERETYGRHRNKKTKVFHKEIHLNKQTMQPLAVNKSKNNVRMCWIDRKSLKNESEVDLNCW